MKYILLLLILAACHSGPKYATSAATLRRIMLDSLAATAEMNLNIAAAYLDSAGANPSGKNYEAWIDSSLFYMGRASNEQALYDKLWPKK